MQAEEIDALKVRLKEKDVVVTSTAAAAEDEVKSCVMAVRRSG